MSKVLGTDIDWAHPVPRQDMIVHHDPDFGQWLARRGLLSTQQLASAMWQQAQGTACLDQVLVASGMFSQSAMLAQLASYHSTEHVDLETRPPDPELLEGQDPHFWIKNNAIPYDCSTGVLRIATASPASFAELVAQLPDTGQTVGMVIADRNAIHTALAKHFRLSLTAAASARVAPNESCRNWHAMSALRAGILAAVFFGTLGVATVFTQEFFTAVIFWAVFTLTIAAGIRIAAYVAHFRGPARQYHLRGKTPLPSVSVLVPLFRETEIANALVQRLSRLNYPKALLDVVLVLEETDRLTRDTLAAIDLPNWMRVVTVPDGGPKTKPRAMNYALDFCHGEIIGIWDAEDAPAADQLLNVASHFETAPTAVVCLQGVLDYYNPRQNWLARCFTIEYATWFRLMLPGMSRLGLAIPLGGTTLFFRRQALEELGGWDAHNVTEDADLGFRLARHGYRTEMVSTATHEEANCRLWPWIKQRSRWLKGYMVTYLVHMRAPLTLYRQMGARQFWGFQAHFISALSQFFLAPFLWSFWLVLFGLPHPLDGILGHDTLMHFAVFFICVELINMTLHITAVSRPSHRHLLAWVPSLHFYYPLGAIAAYKALYEIIFKPFFWDKTQHGLSLGQTGPRASTAARSVGRVQLEAGHESL